MRNAPTQALERGWDFYRTTNPRPDLDAVNAQLVADGWTPVSARAIKHYGNMDRYGQVTYLPINEMDMRIKRRRQGNPDES